MRRTGLLGLGSCKDTEIRGQAREAGLGEGSAQWSKGQGQVGETVGGKQMAGPGDRQ